jgi:hypothetical protein
MNVERRGVLNALTRQAETAKRRSGRIVVSALGFALAYYFDTTNGPARRRQLHAQLRSAARKIHGAFAPDHAVADAPAVFSPLLQSKPKGPTIRSEPQSKTG